MIKVKAKTRKGKNRIRVNGDLWEEIERKDSVELPFVGIRVTFPSDRGPWILLESVKTKSLCWIHLTKDENFDIVGEE